jgi:sugar lactone lactonase YvrE
MGDRLLCVLGRLALPFQVGLGHQGDIHVNFETIATGYCFLEAPRTDGDVLWFTDLLIGGLYRMTGRKKTDVFLADKHHIGGVAINHDGKIIFGGKDGVSWFNPETGKSGVLLDAVDGKKLPGVNDFIPDSKGGLYFGTLSQAGDYGQPPSLTHLYYMAADGSARLLRDGVKFSNGMCLSPDGKRFYHNESLLGTFAYDVLPNGDLTNRALFCEKDDGDGMAMDAEGGVWIAYFATAEIVRFLPDGKVDRRIPIAHKVASSLCFGGADGKDIYVTTGGNKGVDALFEGALPPKEASIFYARSDVAGMPVPRTRFKIG